MRTLVTIFAALCCVSSLALAQSNRPQVVMLHLGDDPADPEAEALIIPAASPVHLESFPRDQGTGAVFRGRFTLSGTYELSGYREDSYATFWPNKKSRERLPYWRARGGPGAIYLSNGWALAEAVAPKARLAKLQADPEYKVRGNITVIAENFETSIECDAANFSARFVSVVQTPMRVAAVKGDEGGC